MKNFYNENLKAHNVYELELDLKIVNEIRDFYEKSISKNLDKEHVGDPNGDDRFFIVGARMGDPTHDAFDAGIQYPLDWDSDIKWVSVNNKPTHKRFEKYFREFNLHKFFNKKIDFNKGITLYSFFFVVRSQCNQYNFHHDFNKGTGVNGFTLMSPLYDMSAEDSIHLRYIMTGGLNIGSANTYKYKKGKAIAFGEEFHHSTDMGHSDSQQPLMCFSFGTDKEEYLTKILETAGDQGEHFMHPIEGFSKCRWAEAETNVPTYL